MDKSAIRKFARWARTELITRVTASAVRWGIEKGADPDAWSVNDHVLTEDEKTQRKEILRRMEDRGREALLEEAAWTWFNRFIALRFMEVNGCLPSRVRLFTDENGAFRPKILDEALDLDEEIFDPETIADYKQHSDAEGLYKYLLLTECRSLAAVFPGLFENEGDWTELLFPEPLLREGSVLEAMVCDIPEEDWKDAVQILGWLYQYYNSEKKEEVFAGLKKNKKIGKEEIPAATQLFTPDWIVRYMAENSLGRLWLSGHPEDRPRFLEGGEKKWRYYLDDAPQNEAVEAALADVRRQAAQLAPEDIRIIDPCCGSGHILAYVFDMLMDIYTSRGWRDRDAAASIVENNLYGLDIDLRAAQLAYFSVMMKGVQYDRRFLSRGIVPHVRAVRESNHIPESLVNYFCGGDKELHTDLQSLLDEMADARTYGSLITVEVHDWDRFFARFGELSDDVFRQKEQAKHRLRPFLEAAYMLSRTYDVVITNPPYMGSGNMDAVLSAFVKKEFPDSKADLFACFIERCLAMTIKKRYTAMITQHAWMFLSSYEKLRKKLSDKTIINMIHLGSRSFEEIGGEIVQTTAFVIQNHYIKNHKGTYCRLVSATSQQEKESLFLSKKQRYFVTEESFLIIPGNPIAYWIRNFEIFNHIKLGSAIDARIGMVSGDNERFLRLWYEVPFVNIEYHAEKGHDPKRLKWYPLQKGGDFRYWYGNLQYVINWENDGHELKFNNYQGKRIRSHNYNGEQQFKEGITWNSIASTNFCCRYSPKGYTFDAAGPLCEVINHDMLFYILGFLNSKVAAYLFSIINPTMNFPSGYLASLPFVERKDANIDNFVQENISITKEDWDSFETSWDFQYHPMTGDFASVEEGYRSWKAACAVRFNRLKANEEELNRIFISIYGLEGELTPEVTDNDVTVTRIFDSKEDIPEEMKGSAYALTKEEAVKSLLSYAVGCLFGRYSLDTSGLVYAGGVWDTSKYGQAQPAPDGIIPVLDEDYRTDDLMGRFLQWLDAAYGSEYREENLRFIAEALGGKGSSRDVIRQYFFRDFFADHCRMYRKRPIYWLFDSGKKGGFRALLYMHRYEPDTAARLRTSYVLPLQRQYRAAMAELERRLNGNVSTGERVRLEKKLAPLRDKDEEVRIFEEKLHHLADSMIPLDLDDGVKVNYARFKDVLAKVK